AALAARLRAPAWLRLAAAAALPLLSLIVTVKGESAAAFAFAVLGPLSMASLIPLSLCLAALVTGRSGRRAAAPAGLAPVLGLLGLLLYPAAIGLGPVDPYGWGFRGWELPALLALAAGFGMLRGAVLLPVWIGLSVAAWEAGLYGSRNLWDYLIDPVAWAAAVLFLGYRLVAAGRAALRR
ncbi:hypothetical protein, partial [Propylenella binzhouense]|uniref:hypothetical protein n=1 Tax=Propylenella binzhouense TaxID=2555902 RepID=UPI001367D6EA